LATKTVSKVVELLIDHQILETAERTKKAVETLEDMLKLKKYQDVEPLKNQKKN